MLDPKIDDMARERIDVAIEERWSWLDRETSAIKSRMNSRGLLRSSVTAGQILELYRNELDIQAAMAWGHLKAVIIVVGIRGLGELGTDVKSFIDERVYELAGHLLERLQEVIRPFEKMSRARPGEQMEQAKTHAIRKIHSEIDLFEAALA
jgi:hypothetical protein